eukprot:TRINITY_DN1876_c0_g1_i1.p1 TRINITY_DN1876_c0_g1~~TRINITY_DN1876_c0_g1_i1.p1  ORF type:complete len:295 (+),score=46.11 TRINITY_DN1876_c0_g1_i1:2-886(+)
MEASWIKSRLKCCFPVRYLVQLLIFFGVVISYLIRISLSIVIIPISEEYHWSDTDKGLIMSSFYWGYISTQIVGGWLALKYGGKMVYLSSVLLAGIATIVFPFTVFNLYFAIVMRVLAGISEGMLYPAAFSMVALWFPRQEKSSASALVHSGGPLGTVFADVITPIIVRWFGWQAAFYFVGMVSLVWSTCWLLIAKNSPEDKTSFTCIKLSYEEEDFIVKKRDSSGSSSNGFASLNEKAENELIIDEGVIELSDMSKRSTDREDDDGDGGGGDDSDGKSENSDKDENTKKEFYY